MDIPLPDNYVDLLGKAMTDTTSVETQPQPVDNTAYIQENESLKRELEAVRAQLRAAQEIPDDLKALKAERELDDLLDKSGMDFTTIDKSDVKKILSPVLSTMRKQQADSTSELQRRLSEYEERFNSRFKELDDKEHYRKLEKTRAAILKAHPDLEQLQKTPEYQRTMNTPIGGKSGILIGQLVAEEYRQGNSEYIIDVLSRIKQGVQPELSDIASVSPSASNTTPTVSADNQGDRLTPEQIAELRFKVQNRQISRQEFREIMEKHRGAQ